MKNYQYIKIALQDAFAWVEINRPEQKNAMHPAMMLELQEAFKLLGTNTAIRAICLRGNGASFCAGADLHWMKSAANQSFEQNKNESLLLAQTFQIINDCPVPVIAQIHGAAMGGANGLIAACDFAFCTNDTVFAFSEVKLGIIPATIAPFVIKKIGVSAATELMITGKRFNGNKAEKLGLVNESLATINEVENAVTSVLKELTTAAPNAVKACKQLIRQVAFEWNSSNMLENTANAIATIRTTSEAQEGMNAFFNKTKPSWHEQ